MSASTLPTDVAGFEDFSLTLLEVSLTGFILFRPVYDAAGATITDLAYEYLNPVAQQALQLPQRPAESFLTRFPMAGPAGIFAFYRDAFLSGDTQREAFDFQHNGLDGFFHLVARRQGALLVVSFLETNDPLPVIQAEALRQSQARETEARHAAERDRDLLQALLTQAPVAIGLFQGDDCVVSAASDRLCAMWGHAPAQVLGRPLLVGVPELRGQGFTELLQQVARTRVPFVGTEVSAQLRQPDGQLATHYFNFVYQPLYAPDGAVLGVVDIAVDVTEQVLARQQVQQLNEELELRLTARSAETRTALFEVEQQREQLRVQQHLLSQIMGLVPAAIATFSGPEHRYSFFNSQYQALTAGRASLGRSMAEVLPEVVEQGFLALLDQVYTTGQPYIGTETAVMLHDQTTGRAELRYVDFIYQPLFDGQQRPQGVLAFVLDVTDRVRARKQADTLQAAMLAVVQRQAQQRQELYQIFEQTPVAIVLLREPDHRIDYFNPAFRELFPPEEWAGPLQGHTLAEVYPRVRLAGLVELLDKVYATGESQYVLDMPLAKLQPGSPRYVTFAYQAYHEQGRIVGVAAFVYDVTEQVLARQQREAYQQRLERLMMQAPAAICVLGGDKLVFELVNPGYQQLFPGRALLGKPVLEALPELVGQPVPAMLWGVYETGVTFEGREIHMLFANDQDGHIEDRYFNFIYQARYDAAGVIDGLVVFAFEITEPVRTRQQVQRLNQELAAINEQMQATNAELHDTNTQLTRTNADLDTFVYSASHDLKSPITNIEGLLTALREHLPADALTDPLVPRLLGMMDGAVARFQQTLGYLTDISRLQQAILNQPAEKISLLALVEDVRLDILPELTAAAATLTVDVAACPTLRFSPKNLRSIVYNLLSNAIKYHAPDRAPEVHLRCREAAGQTVLEVQDNGLGLSVAQQGQLFRMFRRLHSHVLGSGVGLYMVKKMVENAGGTITVQSELGVGSTFTVSLPHAG